MLNPVAYFKQLRKKPRLVWYLGSTALKKGWGMCYDLDYTTTATGETATDPFEARGNFVVVPDNTNNLAFAGVTAHAYKAKVGGQLIEIHEPGSVALIAVGFASVINETILTCSVSTPDAGRFTFDGFQGRGSALALETQALADGGNITEKALDGTATTAWVDPVLTISFTGIGTACGYGDSDIDPTDFVAVVLGGADNAAGGDASSGEMAVAGEYPVLTAPTADTITIGTDIGDVDATLYIIKNNNPLILAYLQDGEESGCQEVISPQDQVAVVAMVGGVTMACGGYTMGAASTDPAVDGTREGMLKGVRGLGTLTTAGWVWDPVSGLQIDSSTETVTVTIDAANEVHIARWHGSIGGGTSGAWREVFNVGATIA